MTTLVLLHKLTSIQLHHATTDALSEEREQLASQRKTIYKALAQVVRRERSCRLCLRAGRHHVLSAPDLSSDMHYALQLTVSADDGLPQHVCDACLAEVRRAASFKRSAHLAQWRLQQEQHISAEQEREELCEHEEWEAGESGGGDAAATRARKKRAAFKCNKCKEKFTRQEELSAHSCRPHRAVSAVSTDSYVCEVCGKEFKTKFRLTRHCTVHSSQLKYACARCPYRARWPTALLHHTRVHTGERPVQCALCPARFVTPSNLASHRRSHFPPQYKCDTCERAFTNKQGLQNHVVSQHTNVKAHNCNICGKSFSTRRLMRRHELKSHNSPKRRAGTVPVYIQLQQQELAEQQRQGALT